MLLSLCADTAPGGERAPRSIRAPEAASLPFSHRTRTRLAGAAALTAGLSGGSLGSCQTLPVPLTEKHVSTQLQAACTAELTSIHSFFFVSKVLWASATPRFRGGWVPLKPSELQGTCFEQVTRSLGNGN